MCQSLTIDFFQHIHTPKHVYNDVHSCGKGGNLSTKAYKPTLNLF